MGGGLGLVRDALAAVLFGLGLYALGVTYPVLGMLAALFAPVPLALLHLRHGWRVAAPAVVAAGGLAAGAAGALQGLAFAAEVGAPALILGEGLRRDRTPELPACLAALVVGIGSSLLLILSYPEGGMWAAIGHQLEQLLARMQEVYQRLGLAGEGAVETPAQVRNFLLDAFPGLFLSGSVLSSTVAYTASRALAVRWFGRSAPAPFSWTLPEHLVWAFIAAGVLSLTGVHPLAALGLSGLLVLATLYFLQGISIAVFFFTRLRLPRSLGALAIFLLLLQPVLALLVAGVGLFDIWVSFRRLNVPKSPGSP